MNLVGRREPEPTDPQPQRRRRSRSALDVPSSRYHAPSGPLTRLLEPGGDGMSVVNAWESANRLGFFRDCKTDFEGDVRSLVQVQTAAAGCRFSDAGP